ncbi:PaaI family thioesterase [Nocardiopsis coralliicola]
MTVDTPSADALNPADYGLHVVDEADLPAELTGLVARVRSLADAAAHTRAGAADLTAAADALAKAEEILRDGGERLPGGAMLRTTLSDGRAEHQTLTNGVSGALSPVAPPLVLAGGADGVRGEVTMGGVYQGPPGLVHGGWLAALLDQALGSAASAQGMPGLTANLDVNYRNPTPLDTPLEVSARVTSTERRKVFVSGEVRCNGEVTAEGTAIMVRLAL